MFKQKQYIGNNIDRNLKHFQLNNFSNNRKAFFDEDYYSYLKRNMKYL